MAPSAAAAVCLAVHAQVPAQRATVARHPQRAGPMAPGALLLAAA
jgi:hypothetical protein